MTERLAKHVKIMLKTDTWTRDYYYRCFKKSGEQRKDFDKRVYEIGLQNLKTTDKGEL